MSRLLPFAVMMAVTCAPAGASDFGQLRRPEVVRALLLPPERSRQLRCAAALVALPVGPGDQAFVAAVAERVAADIGSHDEVDRLFSEQRRRMGVHDARPAERLTAMSMACHSFGAARAAAAGDLGRLLGPVSASPIPLPTAPECLAAFEADRVIRKPGNDLAADMIDHLAAGVAADKQAQAQLEDSRKRFSLSPPDAGMVEVLAVTCLPAAAALTKQP